MNGSFWKITTAIFGSLFLAVSAAWTCSSQRVDALGERHIADTSDIDRRLREVEKDVHTLLEFSAKGGRCTDERCAQIEQAIGRLDSQVDRLHPRGK